MEVVVSSAELAGNYQKLCGKHLLSRSMVWYELKIK